MAGEATDDLREAVGSATHLLISVPPDITGDPVLNLVREEIAVSPTLESIVYLSTVGVYGDHSGEWIDESTLPRPRSDRSVRRLEAEKAWLSLPVRGRVQVAILRLSGIYGPGRNAVINLRAGSARRVVKPGQVFNRIHVVDIAAAIEATLESVAEGMFNVTDDLPAPPQDIVAYAAQLIGMPVPPEVAFSVADLSPMARSFYSENKRVANDRMKQELGVTLAYPTYREGLQALVAADAGVES